MEVLTSVCWGPPGWGGVMHGYGRHGRRISLSLSLSLYPHPYMYLRGMHGTANACTNPLSLFLLFSPRRLPYISTIICFFIFSWAAEAVDGYVDGRCCQEKRCRKDTQGMEDVIFVTMHASLSTYAHQTKNAGGRNKCFFLPVYPHHYYQIIVFFFSWSRRGEARRGGCVSNVTELFFILRGDVCCRFFGVVG